MNIRLEPHLEQKLNHFANQLNVTKTDLVKPYVLKLLEDISEFKCEMQNPIFFVV